MLHFTDVNAPPKKLNGLAGSKNFEVLGNKNNEISKTTLNKQLKTPLIERKLA
jgi:hypothetical protein